MNTDFCLFSILWPLPLGSSLSSLLHFTVELYSQRKLISAPECLHLFYLPTTPTPHLPVFSNAPWSAYPLLHVFAKLVIFIPCLFILYNSQLATHVCRIKTHHSKMMSIIIYPFKYLFFKTRLVVGFVSVSSDEYENVAMIILWINYFCYTLTKKKKKNYRCFKYLPFLTIKG